MSKSWWRAQGMSSGTLGVEVAMVLSFDELFHGTYWDMNKYDCICEQLWAIKQGLA